VCHLLLCLLLVTVATSMRNDLISPAVGLEHPQGDDIDLNVTSPYWTLFKQCVAPWGGNRLGTCDLTVCQAGCAMSSVAMMLATRGVNTNPGAFNSWLDANGGYANGCDLIWARCDAFGKSQFQAIETASEAAICTGIAAGHGIVANVRGQLLLCLLLVTVSTSMRDDITAPAVGLDHPQGAEIDLNVTRPFWTLFKQCVAPWGGNRLGTCGLTVCQAGCAMSSVAMMLNTRGVATNPGAFNGWLTANGGYANGCDLIWARCDAFGKSQFQAIETASEATLCAGIAAGHAIVANVRGGTHWVLLTGCAGGGVFNVNDP